MNQETLKTITDSLYVATGSTGAASSALAYWEFVNTNAAGLGIGLTFIFGMVAVGFNIYSAKKYGLSDKNSEEISRVEAKVDSHHESTQETLGIIIDKLDNLG